jgi:hypothetical protein
MNRNGCAVNMKRKLLRKPLSHVSQTTLTSDERCRELLLVKYTTRLYVLFYTSSLTFYTLMCKNKKRFRTHAACQSSHQFSGKSASHVVTSPSLLQGFYKICYGMPHS